MITLIRGELIKATTTRTIFAYGALAVALAVAQVLVSILPAWGDPMSLADKTEAIAGLPLLVLLLGLVGAAGEYRHRTAAPATLVAGGTLVAAALSAALGVALGALVRNQVVAVTGTLVVIFVVLPLVGVISPTALDMTPFGAAQGVAGAGLETLSIRAAGVVLVGWTVAALIAAIVTERRRDIA